MMLVINGVSTAEFFRSIMAGTHLGTIVLRNGDEIELMKNNIQYRPTAEGTQYIVRFMDCSNRSRSYQYDEECRARFPGTLSSEPDWDIVNFKYSDMGYIIEQISLGNMEGTLFDARGVGFKANDKTVILEENYETSGRFYVKMENGGDVFYRAKFDDYICSHGQLPTFNIIDFIEDRD